MINFFKNNNQNFDNIRPESYDGIVSQEEYETILGFSIKYVQAFGEIKSIVSGTITVTDPDNDSQEIHFHLDNLVRKCKGQEISNWESIIEEHFHKFPANKSKEKYILKDFDYAKHLLRVSVRAKDILNEEDIPSFIARIDLPDTYTFLVLEYDEKFHYVRYDEISEWETSTEELFEIALQNVSQEQVEVKEYLWEDSFETYIFFSGDFSASYIIQLGQNAPFTIGEYGAVLTVPAKGTAIVHPLNEDSALDFIGSIGETQQELFNEDEVPISDSFYWYYQENFYLFPEIMEEGNIMITYPPELEQLLYGKE